LKINLRRIEQTGTSAASTVLCGFEYLLAVTYCLEALWMGAPVADEPFVDASGENLTCIASFGERHPIEADRLALKRKRFA
jgi:hypothetical protein